VCCFFYTFVNRFDYEVDCAEGDPGGNGHDLIT
jgi:hypothetical protein